MQWRTQDFGGWGGGGQTCDSQTDSGGQFAIRDHLSGAPPSVGAKRTKKFFAKNTSQIAGNGTSQALQVASKHSLF